MERLPYNGDGRDGYTPPSLLAERVQKFVSSALEQEGQEEPTLAKILSVDKNPSLGRTFLPSTERVSIADLISHVDGVGGECFIPLADRRTLLAALLFVEGFNHTYIAQVCGIQQADARKSVRVVGSNPYLELEFKMIEEKVNVQANNGHEPAKR